MKNHVVAQIGLLKDELHADTARITADTLKEFVSNEEERDPLLITVLESICSTRMAKEDYCGLIDFRMFLPSISTETPIQDIEKALVSCK